MHRITKNSIILLNLLLSSACFSASFNMPEGVTPLSEKIYNLHMAIYWICVVIGTIVFSVMIYALVRHRKSLGVQPAKFHSHLKTEIIWATIPFLILVGMAIPASKVLIEMYDMSKSEINIKITGYQWKWKYEYLDEGISFFSNLSTPMEQIKGKRKKGPWYLLEVDKPLIVPINKKIRFLVTSNDVIHSWWVPEMGIKRDAIPGFIYESWTKIKKPGIYRGQCAELCGVNHAYMPIVIEAKPEAEYRKWVLSQQGEKSAEKETKQPPSTTTPTKPQLSLQNLMSLGEKNYTTACVACHKADGSGSPPTYPALSGSKITVGPFQETVKKVLNGVPGTSMQAFKGQFNDIEIAAIVTYVRHSFDNDNQSKYGKNAGGIVQPSDVTKLRE